MHASTTDKRTGKPLLFVGLDVHKETSSEAVAEDGSTGEVRLPDPFYNDLHVLEKRMRQHQQAGYELRVCYEAGPCGFGLARRLRQLGIDCQVIAPSLIPNKGGDRQKNDQRDAVKLARCHRAFDLGIELYWRRPHPGAGPANHQRQHLPELSRPDGGAPSHAEALRLLARPLSG